VREYDDDRYLQWVPEFRKLVFEFLDTEGNTVESLTEEFKQAVQEAKES
jgi:hypothetical protein